MKRVLVYLLAALMLRACAGCGTQKTEEAEEENALTGTLDEVKDFMFVVTDDKGDSYALTFDGETPEGLAEQKIGSRVTVAFTVGLSVVDAFFGQVLSVEAAD